MWEKRRLFLVTGYLKTIRLVGWNIVSSFNSWADDKFLVPLLCFMTNLGGTYSHCLECLSVCLIQNLSPKPFIRIWSYPVFHTVVTHDKGFQTNPFKILQGDFWKVKVTSRILFRIHNWLVFRWIVHVAHSLWLIIVHCTLKSLYILNKKWSYFTWMFQETLAFFIKLMEI